MQGPNSPLFTHLQLTLSPTRSGDGKGQDGPSLLPQLPDKPSVHSSSVQVYIIPTEKNLFMEGFSPSEYSDRPPTLLRGCLYLRVLKPCKIKSITLTFKGTQRTEWPEGIPPKKAVYSEINDIITHTWPFYSCEGSYVNGGADLYQELPKSNSSNDLDVSHLSLSDTITRSSSPAPSLAPSESSNFFSRNLSPVNLIKRATSPIPFDSISTNDIHNVLSSEIDGPKSGNFPPGDYMYTFEHPLRPSLPETTAVTFGSVLYDLTATIVRAGAFKSNLTAKLPISVIRVPSEHNLEENEPVVITRDWEDQLRYEIVVGSKSIILDSYLPLAFRFIPLLGKVSLHRIRVYLTEDLEYFCHDKKVHRLEPQKKFLLLEHKALKGKSILSKSGGMVECDAPEDEEILPREMEFQVYVPKVIRSRNNYKISPDTSFDNIKAHHWIKICLRISKPDPENSEKKKHFEILIDSPIHLLSPLAAHGNTLLPAYDKFKQQQEKDFLPSYSAASPPTSPGVIPVEGNGIQNLPINAHGSHASFSLDAIMTQPPEIEFHHLNSSSNNDEPIERDHDIHLESNIYQPEEGNPNLALHSPQAIPFVPSFLSPHSSVSLHGMMNQARRPTINPPPFSANQLPAEAIPPPAYVKEDPARPNPVTKNSSFSSTSNASSAASQNFEAASSHTDNTSQTDNDPNCTILKITPPSPLSSSRSHISSNELLEDRRSGDETECNSPCPDMTNAPQSEQDMSEEDIVDMPCSPTHVAAVSPIRTHSRRSSVSSTTSSFDLPVGQSFPLLSPSSASLLNPNNNYKSRNSSMISVGDARISNNEQHNPIRITDLVDSALYSDDIYQINENLLSLRNPRIKKHYQDEFTDLEKISNNDIKNRQKSIGVFNNLEPAPVPDNDSSESETTITNEQHNTSMKSEPVNNKLIPGLNFGYAIK